MIVLKRTLIAMILLAAVACQKTYNPDPLPSSGGSTGGGTSGGGGTGSSKLSKSVTVTGSVTDTRTFEYDAAGRLAKYSSSVDISGQKITNSYTLNRDNAGKLITYVWLANIPDFPSAGVTYTCHYTNSADVSDYITSRWKFNNSSDADYQYDSIVYVTTNARITGIKEYIDNQYSSNTVLAYDNLGNLTEYKFYGPDAANGNPNFFLQASVTYTYDDKTNALCLPGQEAMLLLAGDPYISKANYTRRVSIDYTRLSTGTTTTSNSAYTYNVNNQPVKSTITESTGATGTVTYTY